MPAKSTAAKYNTSNIAKYLLSDKCASNNLSKRKDELSALSAMSASIGAYCGTDSWSAGNTLYNKDTGINKIPQLAPLKAVLANAAAEQNAGVLTADKADAINTYIITNFIAYHTGGTVSAAPSYSTTTIAAAAPIAIRTTVAPSAKTATGAYMNVRAFHVGLFGKLIPFANPHTKQHVVEFISQVVRMHTPTAPKCSPMTAAGYVYNNDTGLKKNPALKPSFDLLNEAFTKYHAGTLTAMEAECVVLLTTQAWAFTVHGVLPPWNTDADKPALADSSIASSVELS